MKQRILVLGASGFIGTNLVKALTASDWASPVAASRHARRPSSIETLAVDATNSDQLRQALKDIDGVVNCVAGSGDTIVGSARALFELAATLPHKPRIVHLSSMAVYGACVGAVDESTRPVGELSAYGAAKLEAEELAAKHSGIVILRPGIVYGPGSVQWSGRIGQLLCAHRLGDLGAAGDGYCNLVYIDDTVQAVVRALRSPNVEGRTFNLSLPDPPTWNDYFIDYAKTLGALPVSRITKRRLRIESKLLAPPLKIGQLIVGKISPRLVRLCPEPIPPSLTRLFRQEIRMKVAAVENALGLRWTTLGEGLRQSSLWYRAS